MSSSAHYRAASGVRRLAAVGISLMALLPAHSPARAFEAKSASSAMQVTAIVVRPLTFEQEVDAHGRTTLTISHLGDAEVITSGIAATETQDGSVNIPLPENGEVFFVTIVY